MDRTVIDGALAMSSAATQYELDRFLSQREWALGLCDLHADKSKAWRNLLDKADLQVRAAADKGGTATLRKAVREAEKLMAPIGKTAKSYTIHAVGHGHIDMNWMWGWPETVATVNDQFTTVLRLMDEFPDFHFTQSQAAIYEIVEKYAPEMMPRIKERVQEGRWEVAASHWVEGDKNIVSGESLARHLLYTRRYMQQLFDLAPEDVAVDWSPDTFGHAATNPTYLARGGVKWYYCCRVGTNHKLPPRAFWWQGPDGSRVLVMKENLWYSGELQPTWIVQPALRVAKETGLRHYMCVYGVGDHGGGPTRRDLNRCRDMNDWPIFPAVKLSTVKNFFTALETVGDKLPVIDHELNFEFAGCYTSQSLIKKSVRYADSQLYRAEFASTFAHLRGGLAYPTASLTQGWRDTLFTHFHDILPGSCVHDARTYAHGMYQNTIAAASMAETRALRLLASTVDTSGFENGEKTPAPPSHLLDTFGAGTGFGGKLGVSAAGQHRGDGPRPFVIFNPTATARTHVVTATIWDHPVRWWESPRPTNRLASKTFTVVAPDGGKTTAQMIKSDGIFWGHDYVQIAFPVTIPPMGYATYAVLEQAAPPSDGSAPPVEGTPEGAAGQGGLHKDKTTQHTSTVAPFGKFGAQNDWVRFEIDGATGGIKSLVDKATGLDLADAQRHAGVLEFGYEHPHGGTAWVIGDLAPGKPTEIGQIAVTHGGPHIVEIKVPVKFGQSRFTVNYQLHAGDPNVYVTVEGSFLEWGDGTKGVPILRIAFPLALEGAKGRYEIPFGAVERTQNKGEEVPALRWASIGGKSTAGGKAAGAVLFNDSKHGHSLEGSTLRLTLIRGTYDPDPFPELGQHAIHLALMPFAGDKSTAQCTHLADGHTHPLRLVGTELHKGDLPGAGSFFTVEPASVIVSGVKKAEDSDALVLRLYETTGKQVTATAHFDKAIAGVVRGAAELDLIERPAAHATVKTSNNSVKVTLPAFGIATVRVSLGGA